MRTLQGVKTAEENLASSKSNDGSESKKKKKGKKVGFDKQLAPSQNSKSQ